MGKGSGIRAGRRKPEGHEGQGKRKRTVDKEIPVPPEDDPCRDIRDSEMEPQNPADDEYVWPEFSEENEDEL